MSIKRNALGRVAAIGDLYDVCTDTFLGFSIFDEPIPETLIEVTTNSYEDIDFIHTETISEKFEKLNVVPELRASILANIITLDVHRGHAKYLEMKRKPKKCRQSLIYSIHTQREKVNFDDENNLHDFISIDESDLELATHFVAGVTWGAKTVISMEKDENDGKDDDLTKQLRKLGSAICKTKEGVNENNILDNSTGFSLQLFSDVLPATIELKSINEAEKMLKKIPSFVKAANNGKGMPISYILMPISELKKYFKDQIEVNEIEKLVESFVVNFTTLVDEFNEIKEEINDIIYEFNEHSYCVPVETVRKSSQLKTEFTKYELDLMKEFKESVLAIRTGKIEAHKIALKYKKYNYRPLLQDIKEQLLQYDKVFERINLVEKLRSEGVIYIGLNEETSGFDKLKELSMEKDVLILYLPEIEENSQTVLWNRNKNCFFEILQSARRDGIEPSSFAGAIDLCVRPDLTIPGDENIKFGRICLLKHGHFVDHDVYGSNLRANVKCYAATFRRSDEPFRKYLNLIELNLECPRSLNTLNNQCRSTIHKWHCVFCKKPLLWGFDGNFYCRCGGSLCSKFEFKCNDENHGDKYVRFDSDHLKESLSAIPVIEVNILIMGATGVGKSTWINSFINYLQYSSLEEASRDWLFSVTSTKFDLTDENDTTHTIFLEQGDNEEEEEEDEEDDKKNKNEVPEPGQSTTQDVMAHIFPIGNTILRLIDTPGIGDVRGVEQDKENLKKILKYLSTLKSKSLNGICILLKPNESRLDVLFEFCIKELLTHLHQNAAKNIVFCFTHSRETFYKPGDTRTPLAELLLKNQIDLDLNKDTMYCMDNESFRFLCANKQKVEFSDSVKKSFAESWDVSVKETNRLISYIKTLEPYFINDTISLNDARQNIVCLTKPIVDISRNIQTNLATIKDKQEMLSSTKTSEQELVKMLYLDIIKLETETLNHPRIVCGAKCCVEYNTETDGAVEYIKHCNPYCRLAGVAVEIIGDVRLQQCSAMNGTLNCEECGCCWDQHLHITYVQKPVAERIIAAEIPGKTTERQRIEEFIAKTEKLRVEEEDEQKKILEVSLKLGHYLTTNSIVPYNVVLVRYIDHLIEIEKQKVNIGGNDKILKRLDEVRRVYIEEQRALMMAMTASNAEPLSFGDFQNLLTELYALKHNGSQLRSAIEQASVSGSESSRMETLYRYGFMASDRFESCRQVGHASTLLFRKLSIRNMDGINKDIERNYFIGFDGLRCGE